jgi:hypothetical protein
MDLGRPPAAFAAALWGMSQAPPTDNARPPWRDGRLEKGGLLAGISGDFVKSDKNYQNIV